MQLKKATKQQARLRMALIGPSGSGKTYSALKIASGLGERIAVIDTERGSASKYAGEFQFDVLDDMSNFSPETYVEAIHMIEAAGCDVLIIDSLSHAWIGRDGALEQVDKATKKNSGNSFTAWRDVTPKHNALVDAILQCKCHVIATMRAKTEYVMEPGSNGKMQPRKVGLAAVQRDGMEYEFDVVGDINIDHALFISKTRCQALDGAVIEKPGIEIAEVLKQWLTEGAPMQRSLNEQITDELRTVFLEAGKTEREWISYLTESDLASKPLNQKQALLEKMRARLAEMRPAVTPEQAAFEMQAPVEVTEPGTLGPDHGKILDLTESLKEQGASYDEINKKIASLCGGLYAVEELDGAQAAKAAASLAKWLEQMKQKAARG